MDVNYRDYLILGAAAATLALLLLIVAGQLLIPEPSLMPGVTP